MARDIADSTLLVLLLFILHNLVQVVSHAIGCTLDTSFLVVQNIEESLNEITDYRYLLPSLMSTALASSLSYRRLITRYVVKKRSD